MKLSTYPVPGSLRTGEESQGAEPPETSDSSEAEPPTRTEKGIPHPWNVGVCVLFQILHSGRVASLLVSPRPISTSHLHPLPGFQFWPINPMVCGGP